MAKRQAGKLLSFVTWLAGVVVSLSVGFAMIGGTLTLPWWLGGSVLAIIAGWVVVISTLLSAVLALTHY